MRKYTVLPRIYRQLSESVSICLVSFTVFYRRYFYLLIIICVCVGFVKREFIDLHISPFLPYCENAVAFLGGL